ncbi:pilus assembly protein [Pelagibacterium sp. H642]|uniref:pilus assembly protein n=1 Tax=Pelagibacterium sp. H642 TaxID=1881069 RepID=UPI002815F649|nr:pilus assembly protein [Pelagibacterium sp. H642]WMT92876.1 pilus assembly protein [Pelagibacterium sp. H642]
MTRRHTSNRLRSRILALPSRFGRDQSGAAAILMAILFPVIVMALGLGAETGYWYLMQRQLQNAADVSAYAGAVRNRAGDSYAEIEATTINIAHENGLPADAPRPLVTTPFEGDPGKVEVILERSVPRLFAPIVPGSLTARAVSKVSAPLPEPCVLALSPDAGGAVTIGGSADLNLNGCDLSSNSSATNAIDLYGSVAVNAGCASAVGGVQGTHLLTESKDCSTSRTLASAVPDPYAHLSPPNQSLCGSVWEGQTVRCHDGLSLTQDLLFDNSLYIITGGQLSAKSPALAASNVTFILSGSARLSLEGNSELTLSAPTSGPYKGVLFYGDQRAGVTNTIRGTLNSTFDGASYFPGSNVEYSGNSATGCTRIIAQKITFTGHSAVSCQVDDGTAEITERDIKLVE